MTENKETCMEVFLKSCGNNREGVLYRLEKYGKLVEQGQFGSIGEAFIDKEVRSSTIFSDCVEPLTAPVINQLYSIYRKLPSREGDGTPYAGGIQPSKKSLRGFLKHTTIAGAFVELIDNIFDNYDEEKVGSGLSGDLNINITIREKLPDFPNGIIVIEENSGGVSDKKKVPLVRLGHSVHTYRSIGTWGWGAKLAYHTLGKDLEIYSWHLASEDPFCFWYPPDWLEPIDEPDDPKQWDTFSPWYNWSPNECKLIEDSKMRLNKGSTITIIKNPRHPDELGRIVDPDQLVRFLSNAFADKLKLYEKQKRKISLIISDDAIRNIHRARTVEEIIGSECSFLPGLSPICVNYKWRLTGDSIGELGEDIRDSAEDQELLGSVYVGLTPEGESSIPNMTNPEGSSWVSKGLYMWGNDRIFIDHLRGQPEKADDFIYAQKFDDLEPNYSFKIPKWEHPQINRFHVWIKFSAKNPQNIPWTAPRKVRFAKVGNPFIVLIHRSVFDTVIGFAHFAAKSYKFKAGKILAPWTRKWNISDSEQRLKALFPKGYPSKLHEGESDPQHQKRLKELRKRKDVREILKHKMNLKIPHFTQEQFHLLKSHNKLQCRSKKAVQLMLNRMEYLEDPEYENATLVDLWCPFFRVHRSE